MLNIEMKKTFYGEEGIYEEPYYLVLNGKPYPETYMLDYDFEPTLNILDDEVSDILLSHNYKEVREHFHAINLGYELKNWQYVGIAIFCREDDMEPIFIEMDLAEDELIHWNKPWSVSQVAILLKKNVEKLGNPQLKYWQREEDTLLEGFGIVYMPKSNDGIIELDLKHAGDLLEALLEESLTEMSEAYETNSIVTYFQFPEEIKIASKQYLIYFAQFLSDIGITADTEIKEELSKTLFKVTPKDGKESLDKIREALTLYLNTPGDENALTILETNSDVAAIQLNANILHFKSQLMLAQSAMQMKDAAIESLKLSNYEYSKMLETKSKETNTEEVIKGVVSVKDYDGSFFRIHLPEIFRKLKRK